MDLKNKLTPVPDCQGTLDAQHCLSLPHVTEQVQWGDNLVFKVGGRIFAVAPLEPAALILSFKCNDEEFAELIERPGIVPCALLGAREVGRARIRKYARAPGYRAPARHGARSRICETAEETAGRIGSAIEEVNQPTKPAEAPEASDAPPAPQKILIHLMQSE